MAISWRSQGSDTISMLVWHTLVATPVMSLWRRQFARPAMVFPYTFERPRRMSLTVSLPSMLIKGETLPSCRIRAATSSVMGWPLVKTRK